MKTFYCADKRSYKNVLGGVFAALALAFTALLFAGCENFLKGEDVQQEIKNVIEYNNAPSYVINVETLKNVDGEIKTPATHEIEKKVTDVFPIRFEPDENHKFIEWQAIIQDLNAGEKPSDYIVFEDPTSLETNVTFKKASSKVIIIRPVCPPRLTYTFKQGDGDIYPRDSSIEFTFNQSIAEDCFPVNSQVPVENYVTIQGLEETEVEKYYKPPRVNDEKLVFNSDVTNGWIPIQNLQRSISVKIDKDKIWYYNKDYSNKNYKPEGVQVLLDEDIKVSFNINSETSKKTYINYQVRPKDDDKPVGTLKIDGEENTNSNYPYSVGQQVSLRFKLDEGYTFYGWAFKKNGETVSLEDLSITFGDEDYANNLVQTTFTVDNYTEGVITIIPQVYDPVKVKFVKGAEGSGSLKANTTTIVQDEQSFDFAVGTSFPCAYKVADGYFFHGWNFERTYKDSTGAKKTEPVSIDELENYGIVLTKDDDTDENGYNKNTRIAQINLTVAEYTDNVISVIPQIYDPVKFKFVKGAEGSGTLKVNSTTIVQDEQSFDFGVGNIFSCTYKVAEGYYFHGWNFERTYKDSEGADKTEPVAINDLKNYGITFTKDDESDENGYNKNTRLAQINLTVEGYTDNVITVIPQVYDPVKFKFVKGVEGSGTLKANSTTIVQDEQSFDFGVGNSFSCTYKVADGYYFYGWKFERTYKDSNGANKTDPIALDKLADYGFTLTKDDDADANGYDKATRIAQINLTINSYTDNVISISPVCFENLKITKFNLGDNENFYERDNDITIEFNKALVAACKDKITIKIPNLPEGKTTDDYFEPAVINGKVYTRKAKKGTVSSLIPVTQDGTNTITISLNSAEVYYEVPLTAATGAKVGLASDTLLSYKINSETVNKTKIKFHQDDTGAKGSLKVDDVSQDEQTMEYSIGKSFVLKYKLSNDYKFYGWKFTRTYKDTEGQDQSEEYTPATAYNLYLSIRYEDSSDVYGFIAGSTSEGQAQATITVDDYIDGVIQIEPVTSVIPVGTVVLEENNGKINSNNERLTTLNGLQVKIAETKKGDENIIRFTPDSAYQFIKWQVYDRNTGNYYTDNVNDYVRFTDDSIENTSYRLIDVPSAESNIQLAIKPIVAERPQILDCTPSSSGTTLLRKDSTIQIIFDYDMDEESIYYTGNELKQVRTLIGLEEDEDEKDEDNKLLKSSTNNKYFGYVKDSLTFYKNISIRNNNVSSVNPLGIITQYFKEPTFDNPRTLSIGVDDKEHIPSYIQILVNVGKIEGEIGNGFFYTKDDKVVSMSGYKRWIYRINDKTDTDSPSFKDTDGYQFAIKTSGSDSASNLKKSFSGVAQNELGLGSVDYVSTSSLYVDISLLDKEIGSGAIGSGLASNFIVECKKLYDEKYTEVTSSEPKNYVFDYQSNDTATAAASYKGNISLTDLEEGIYSLKLKFRDQSGNEFTEPAAENSYYYFCYDKTLPFAELEENENPLTVTDADDVNNKLKLAWDASAYKDLKESEIKYKKHSDDSFDDGITISTIAYDETTQEIASLDCGTLYDFQITYKDFAGHERTFDTSAYTRPETPTVIDDSTPVVSQDIGTSVTITGKKPDGVADYSTVRIKYKTEDSTTWQETNVSLENIEDGCIINNLENAKKYEFDICAYDENSGKYSLPYKLGGNKPVFYTQPSEMSIGYPSFSSYTNKGWLYFNEPESNYTGIKVYISTKADFDTADATTRIISQDKSSVSRNSDYAYYYFANNLTPGTHYYTKVLAYYNTVENCVETDSIEVYTKPSAVTNLTSTKNNNSITLSWTKPAGDYSSYTISYKTTNVSSWTSLSIPDTEKSLNTYTINNLTAGNSYNVKVVTNSNSLSSEIVYLGGSSTSSTQLYPSAATNLSVTKGSALTTANVSWTKPTGSYTTLYLYKSTSSDFSTDVSTSSYAYSSTTTSASFTGLTTGTTYYFKIRTYINNTLYAETETAMYSTDIEAVSNATLSANGKNSIYVYWIPPSSEYDGIRIYRGSELKKTIYASEMASYKYNSSWYRYNDTGLNPNTSYTYTIYTYKQPVGSEEKTAYYNVGARRTAADYVTNIQAVAQSSSSVKLTWTNPTNTSYWNQTYIYKQKSSGDIVYVGNPSKSSTTYTVTGLDAGSYYHFYIKTSNADGSESYSSFANNVQTKLSTVSNVSCSPASTTSISMSWKLPTGLYDGVKIYYRKSNVPDWTYYTSYSTTTTTTISGLSAATYYYVKFVTYKSGFDNQETSEYAAYTKPSAPSISVDSRGTNSVTLNFSASSNNGSIIYYKKHSDTSWSSVSVGTTTSTTKTISGLESGIKYDFYATSCYVSASNISTSSTIYAVTNLAQPSGLYATVYEGDVTLHWDRAGDANYFYIYYKKHTDTTWSTVSSSYLGMGTTQYTFTGLNNYTQYDFKIKSNYCYNSSWSQYVSSYNDLYSPESEVCSLWTPPSPVTNMSLWSDDGMGTIIVKYKPSTDSQYTEFFVGNTYVAYSNSGTNPSYKTITIPNFKRGAEYSINARAYHAKNEDVSHGNNAGEGVLPQYPKETLSKSCTINVTSNGYITVNGNWQSCFLKNVTTSNVSVTKNDSSSSSAFYGSGSGSVTLTPYSIGAWEICQTLYQEVMGNNPSTVKQSGGSAYPVTNVSWYAAIAFCNKLSVLQGLQPCYEISGYSDNDWKNFTYINLDTIDTNAWNTAIYHFDRNGYHLPTEWQWEFAARGGSPSTSSTAEWNYSYSGSNTATDVGWVSTNAGGSIKTATKFKSNRLGLFDMTGNASEWLTDWYYTRSINTTSWTDPYVQYNGTSATGPVRESNYACVIYKNTKYENNYSLKSWDWWGPNRTFDYMGFRVCRNKTYAQK